MTYIFFILAKMKQISISTAELAIPRGIRSKKAKAGTEAHPETTEAKKNSV